MADAVIAAVVALLAAAAGANAAAAGVVDPTEPPPGYRAVRSGDAKAPEAALPEPVRLQMIARSGAARIAVVNGHRVRTGEAVTLDGKSVKVAAIRDDSIVLDRDGHQQILQLMPRAALKAVCAAQSSDRPGCRNDAPGAHP